MTEIIERIATRLHSMASKIKLCNADPIAAIFAGVRKQADKLEKLIAKKEDEAAALNLQIVALEVKEEEAERTITRAEGLRNRLEGMFPEAFPDKGTDEDLFFGE